MKRLNAIVALTMTIAACGSSGSTDTTTLVSPTTATNAPIVTTSTTVTDATTTTTTAAEPENMLTVIDSEFGPILADADGYTLYMFVPDDRGDSVCYGDCEAAWPVFYTPAATAEGVDSTLIDETTRTDDTTQVTYNGWPLYYFADDAAPGDTTGQGRGDVWYVVTPDGVPIVAIGEPVNQLTVVDSSFGPILADEAGNVLYVFLPDEQGDSTCYDDCEAAWPTFLVPSYTGGGIDGSLVDTTERTDATVQVTYNGWPLYYFANDATPGDTTGQGRGDVWYVIGPDGEAIRG